MLTALFAVALFKVSQSTHGLGQKVMLTEAAEKYGAVCLDGMYVRKENTHSHLTTNTKNIGTPPVYYLDEGMETTKYVIFTQGGGIFKQTNKTLLVSVVCVYV